MDISTIFYYARAINRTPIIALSTPVSLLSTATTTTTTTTAVSHLFDYCSTRPEATIRYYASSMQLNIHSYASYLSEPKAKSRIGGYFYLGNNKNNKNNNSTLVKIAPYYAIQPS
jgi:hypothetical protein